MHGTARTRHRRRRSLVVARSSAPASPRRPRSARAHDTITLTVEPLRRLRLPRPLQAVRGVAPRHHDQGGHPGLRRPPHEPREAHRHRRGRRRHRGDRGRLHRAVHGAAAELRRPPPVRRGSAQEPLAAVEVAAGGRQRRRVIGLGTDVGSLAICYRDGPVQEGRPADEPRRGRRSCGRRGRRSSTPASGSRRTRRRARHFFDSGSNVYNAMIGQLNPAYYDADRQGHRRARTRRSRPRGT